MSQTLLPRRLKKKHEISNKIQIDLTREILDLIMKYVLSSNSNITFKKLRDVKKLFDFIDAEKYNDDYDIRIRIYIMEVLLKCVVVYKIEDAEIVTHRIREGKFGSDAALLFTEFIGEEDDVSNSQALFVEEFISDRLQYAFIYTHRDRLETKLHQLRTSDFSSLNEFCMEFKTILGGLYKDLANVSLMNRYAHSDFSTDPESLESVFSSTIIDLNKPSNIIKTGIKKLNEMLNGGFQSNRVYLAIAETGGLIF